MIPASQGWIREVVFLGRKWSSMFVRSGTFGWHGALSTNRRMLLFWERSDRSHLRRNFSQRVLVIQPFGELSYWTGKLEKSLGNPLGLPLFPITSSLGFSVPVMLAVTNTVTLSLATLLPFGLSDAATKPLLASPLKNSPVSSALNTSLGLYLLKRPGNTSFTQFSPAAKSASCCSP